MSRFESAYFAQFSFVRDAKGGPIELSSQVMDEQIMLVVDGESRGLSRFHVFEGLAERPEVFEAFRAEKCARFAHFQTPSISR